MKKNSLRIQPEPVLRDNESNKERKSVVCTESLDVKTVVRKRLPSITKQISMTDLLRLITKPIMSLSSNTREAENKSNNVVNVNKRRLRKRVIRGDFMNSTINCYGDNATTVDTWKCKEWQLLVFVSSTFTDTKAERNILLDRILPYLKAMALPHDIEVTFVDMRWGVLDEHTIDHKTWNECQREIMRCRDESSGLFFLSLQSEKYGYRPLPRTISRRCLNIILDNCSDQHLVQLAREWYVLDSNACPEEYVLKKLDSLDNSHYWNTVLPSLRQLLDGVRFDKASSREIALGRSVSEWEVKYALKNPADVPRALWIQRIFNDPYEDDAYCDTRNNQEIDTLKRNLLDWMSRKLNHLNRMIVHSHISHSATIARNALFKRYAARWEDETLALLAHELQEIIKSREQWDNDGCGLMLNGYAATEFLHHCKLAHDLCVQFFGREDLLRRAHEHINQPNRTNLHSKDVVTTRLAMSLAKDKSQIETKESTHEPHQSTPSTGKYACISLAIVGRPGFGKSAVMAKLADMVYRTDRNFMIEKLQSSQSKYGRPLLIRFCGSSANSLTSSSIVRSLRLQISYLLGSTSTVFTKPPSDLEQLQDQLKNFAVVLFIDGVDLLSGNLTFLENLIPHRDTRIVVSTSKPSEGKDLSQSHLQVLIDEDVPLLELEAPTAQDLVEIMKKILIRKKRQLTRSQWHHVSGQMAVEPTPLYMAMAVEVVQFWSSDEDPSLKPSLAGIFDQILNKVERECGVVMSRLALGLITYSARGVNDNEMEDILSYDPDVLTAVFQYNVPSVARIPTHVWTRLRRSLEGLLVEKHHGCLSWKHEALQAIALHRYKDNESILHQKLGEYFGDRIPDLTKKLKKLNSSPLLVAGESVWLDSARPNYRRCEEGAINFVRANMLQEAVEEICNIEYICATFLCSVGGSLVPILEELLQRICLPDSSATIEMETTVRHFLQWLQRAHISIEDDPRLNIPLTVTAEPINSTARIQFLAMYGGSSIPCLLSAQFSNEACWIRGLRLPLEEKTGQFVGRSCAVWSRSGLGILTTSGDSAMVLWDGSAMEIRKTIRGREQKAITHLEWSPVGEKVLARAWDGTTTLWNVSQGTNIYCMSGSINVTAVGWRSDGQEFVTGTADSMLIIWSADGFNKVRESKRLSEYYISSVQWSPFGTHIAALTLSTHIRVWNLKTNEVKAFSAHTQQVHGFSWSPDGKRIASASDDMKVAVWDASDLTLPYSAFTAHKCPVKCVHWCGEGTKVASGDMSGNIYVWSPDDKSVYHKWCASSLTICSVIWSPDSQKLLSLSHDGAIVIFESWVASNTERRADNRRSSTGAESRRKVSQQVETSSRRKTHRIHDEQVRADGSPCSQRK